MTLKIRQYQPSDNDDVWELHRLALEPTGAMLPGGQWNDDDLNDIQKNYIDDGGDFLIGILDNRIVCMGALRKKSETMAEIKRMRVHPDYQRKGFGQMILDILEEKARKLGYTESCLDTTTKQIPAQKLYEKNGYHQTSRTSYAGLEIIFYEKKIK
ncbi:MAG TPA: GNAT family N-acetyltransferase [Dehalococcoidales bacterium]